MFARFLAPLAVAAVSVLPLVACAPPPAPVPVPAPSGPAAPTTPATGINVQAFANQLSKNAQIYVPNDSQFKTYTVRWSNLEAPTVNVVVLPGTEQDVSKIVSGSHSLTSPAAHPSSHAYTAQVKYAYDNCIPILAYNGHHGSLTTLGKMDYGIAINLVQLNSFAVAKDGTTVTVGGGINSHNLTEQLWAAGKQTVTGTCECVSYLGPALGGGHGWLQGHHGLISDQFVSLNIVLATGEVKKIDQSSDLMWGLKGAGHNFGIVTSVTSKVYDIVQPNWAIETIVFSGDKIEEVYDAANAHLIQNGTQTPDIHQWSYWLNDATLDAEKPVIVVYTMQEGVDAVESKYTEPFKAIGPLAVTPQAGTYRDLGAWTNIALDSPPCQDFGFNNPRFPIYIKSYNGTALRAAYEVYASAISGADNPYTNSIVRSPAPAPHETIS